MKIYLVCSNSYLKENREIIKNQFQKLHFISEILEIDKGQSFDESKYADFKYEDSIFITDDPTIGKALKEKIKKSGLIALLTEENEHEDMFFTKNAITSIEVVSDAYMEERIKELEINVGIVAETDHLVLRRIQIEDVETLFSIYKEPSITKYIGPLYPNIEEEIEYTKKYQENIYGYYGFGMWIIEDKKTKGIVGRAGIEYRSIQTFDSMLPIEYKIPLQEGLELGYMVSKEWQRQGVATEVCKAIFAYTKENLEAKYLYCLVKPENIPSICFCEKLEFSGGKKVVVNKVEYRVYYKEV